MRLCEDERRSIGFIERLYSLITSSIVGSLFPTGRGSKKGLKEQQVPSPESTELTTDDLKR